MKNDTVDVEFSKPTHDARNEYYKVLILFMSIAKTNYIMGNYVAWYRGLWSVYHMVCAYIDPATSKEIKDSLENTSELVAQINNVGISDPVASIANHKRMLLIEKNLLAIEEKIQVSSKDMMLPTGQKQGDIDLDDLMRKSDL